MTDARIVSAAICHSSEPHPVLKERLPECPQCYDDLVLLLRDAPPPRPSR